MTGSWLDRNNIVNSKKIEVIIFFKKQCQMSPYQPTHEKGHEQNYHNTSRFMTHDKLVTDAVM